MYMNQAMLGITGRTLTNSHERGVITSPAYASNEGARAWLSEHNLANADVFVPALKGGETKQLFPEHETKEAFLAFLGEITHLDKATDWENGVIVTQIHRCYDVRQFVDGWVAVLNADFYHSIVVEQGPTGEAMAADPKGGP
jgi:hypothetical protein